MKKLLASIVLVLLPLAAVADPVDFFAYDPAFAGGVRVALCGPDYLGRHWLITAPGPGGGPHIRAFVLTPAGAVSALVYSFFAFDPSFTGGVHISCSIRPDGVVRLATGADAGGGPRVITWALP